jgi:hypothetical protein
LECHRDLFTKTRAECRAILTQHSLRNAPTRASLMPVLPAEGAISSNRAAAEDFHGAMWDCVRKDDHRLAAAG